MPPKRRASTSQTSLLGYFGQTESFKKANITTEDFTVNNRRLSECDNDISNSDNDTVNTNQTEMSISNVSSNADVITEYQTTDTSTKSNDHQNKTSDIPKYQQSETKSKASNFTSRSTANKDSISRHKQYDHTKRKRSFKDEWKSEYEWVKYDEDEGIMFCEYCRKFPKLADTESQLFKGAGDTKQGFRKDTLKFHHKSKSHVKCQHAMKALAAPKSTPMAKIMRRMNTENIERLKYLFNTAYYVVQQHMAFRKFETLCKLQLMNGVNLGNNYINDHGCKDFIMSIAHVLKSETIEEISTANYFSILGDGSTDSAIIEQEAVYVRFVCKGKPVTKLVQFVAVESSTSQGVYDGIKSALKSIEVTPEVQTRKQIGLNLDGASVNMGHKAGVQVLARNDVPHTLVIHCINHNIELAILDVKKGTPYLQKFDEALKLVFKFYYYSPKRRRELYEMAKVLDNKLVHYGGIQQIRWLASQERALKALSQNYRATIVHLEDIASIGNRKDSAEAKGILKYVQTTKFCKFLHFMIDYSTALSTVSQTFQTADLLITEVIPQLTTVLLKLGGLKTKPGTNLKSFLKKHKDGEFSELKLKGNLDERDCEPLYVEMIDSAMQYIDVRFGKLQSPPYSSFPDVFDFSLWPHVTDELVNYGTDELEGILNHFITLFTAEQRDAILEEWLPFKLHVSKLRTSSQLDVYGDLLRAKPAKFINILHVVEIMMAISVSTSGVERGFSTMNIEKDSKRTQMNQNTLNAVMEINVNGPPLSEFNALKSVEYWLDAGPGYRHIDGHAVTEPVAETVTIDSSQAVL